MRLSPEPQPAVAGHKRDRLAAELAELATRFKDLFARAIRAGARSAHTLRLRQGSSECAKFAYPYWWLGD